MFDLSKIDLDNFTYLEETTSTIDVIKDMAKKGAEEYTCCFAESQTKARGRFRRAWQTYPHKSLAFSFLLHDFQEVIPLVLCCSLHRVLNEKYKAKVAIKWPNDIYYNDKKLSGILVESYPLGNNKRAYVVGFGLNIFVDEDRLERVGFLEEATDVEISREKLLVDIFNQIKKDIEILKVDGFLPFKQYFMQNCLFVNQEITITNNNKLDTGIFVGINDNGYLILKQKEVILDISAGQIVQENS